MLDFGEVQVGVCVCSQACFTDDLAHLGLSLHLLVVKGGRVQVNLHQREGGVSLEWKLVSVSSQ